MTEERMIRIEASYPRKKISYRIELGDASSQLGADVIEKECRVGDLEPAPPKDWRPYCFSESPLGVCGGAIDIDSLGYLGNRCKKCPYRKME